MPKTIEQAVEEVMNAGSVLNTNEPDEVQVHYEPEAEVAEGEIIKFAREVAKKTGWRPKEEWTGDPDKFEDADKYLLERIPEKITSLKDRVRQTGAAAEAALEVVRQKAREDALNEIRQAAMSGNAEAAVAAAQKVAANAPQLDPEVIAWRQKNSWFDSDPNAAQLAVQIAQIAYSRGLDTKAQLKAVDDQMSLLTPNYYANRIQETKTEKLPDRVAPSVQPGNRGTNTRPKDGWDSLPSDVKASLNPMVKRMASTFPNIDINKHRESVAKSYYKELK